MPARVSNTITSERVALYGAVSTCSAIAVVVVAFRERSNFYAATVWLSRSNGSMMVLLNFALFLSLIFGKLVQHIFFGQLRRIEIEHLYERSWYSLADTLLAMTIFRDEFDVAFLFLFGILLFLKAFHWLSTDRVEFMQQSPFVPRLFHIRMCAILSTLFFVDLLLVAFVTEILVIKQNKQDKVGIMILFASEFIILTTSLCSTIAKYIINCKDLRSEEPWEAKSMYIFYVDLCNDVLKLLTHFSFFILLTRWYGLPLSLIRDLYVTGRSCASKIRDLIRYRQATRNMDSRYPNATLADMQAISDGTCIICREDMEVEGATTDSASPQPNTGGLNTTPKKLPCGHIFHFHCLRSWLERQQSCPTCRRTVLQESGSSSIPTPRPAPAQPVANPAAPPLQAPQQPEANADLGLALDQRLRTFLQRLQSDAQRVREQGNTSARRAAATNLQATTSSESNLPTHQSSNSNPPSSVYPSDHATPTTSNHRHHPSPFTPNSQVPSVPHQPTLAMPPITARSASHVGFSSPFASLSEAANGLWMPPPPSSLELPGRERRSMFSSQHFDAKMNGSTFSDPSPQTQSSSSSDNPSEKGKEKELTMDPVDAREAVRLAALKIFANSTNASASASHSNISPHSFASTSTRSFPTQLATNGLPNDSSSPTLIPLFDLSSIPDFHRVHHASLPYPLKTLSAPTPSSLQYTSPSHFIQQQLDQLSQIQVNIDHVVGQLTQTLLTMNNQQQEQPQTSHPP